MRLQIVGPKRPRRKRRAVLDGAPIGLKLTDAMSENDEESTSETSANGEDFEQFFSQFRTATQPATFTVKRTVPMQGEYNGYLGILNVDPSNLDSIPEQMRQLWGGGTFSLQAKMPAKQGGTPRFGRAATIVIAGAPRHRTENALATYQPGGMPSHIGGVGDAVGVVQMLLEQILPRISNQQGQGQVQQQAAPDLAGLLGTVVQAVRSIAQPQQTDPLAQIERAVRLVHSIQGGGQPLSGTTEASVDGIGPIIAGALPILRDLLSRPGPPPRQAPPRQAPPRQAPPRQAPPRPAPQPRPVPAPPPGWALSPDGTEYVREAPASEVEDLAAGDEGDEEDEGEFEPLDAETAFEEIMRMSDEDKARLLQKFQVMK